LTSSRSLLAVRLTFKGPINHVMCFWSRLGGQVSMESCYELEEVSLASD
jgi:hypothetical protein